MNASLCELAEKYISDKCDKYGHSYTQEYERILTPFRDSSCLLLEIGIGVSNIMIPLVGPHYKPGASLRMWRDYFPNARIVGCDIIRDVLFSEDRIQTFYVDQSDAASLQSLVVNDMRASDIDIIIDDGSHKLAHQRTTFKTLWPYVRKGGIYIIEDIITANIDAVAAMPHDFGFADTELIITYTGNHWWDNFVAWRKT
jgi:8-demethyl-8-alpha-L-rhamnosyltetracenomycin-C 2'-O-methyltransferase